MARTGLTYSVAADTKDFQREVKRGVLDNLEDTQRALEDVARAGDRAGGDLEDSMRDAAKRTDDMSDAVKDLDKAVDRGARSSFRKFAREADDSMGDAVNATEEFRDEAKSNISEVASSFTGDLDSAVDVVQGTLGGLAGSLPGLLGGATAVAGAAVGLFYTQWQEQNEKTREAVNTLADDMIESGNRFVSESQIQQGMLDIIQGSEDAFSSIKDVQNIASLTGADETTVLRALAGDAAALNEILPVVRAEIGSQVDALNKARAASDGYLDETPYIETLGRWKRVQSELDAVNDRHNKAREQVDRYNDAVDAMTRNKGPLVEQQGMFEQLRVAAEDAGDAVAVIPGRKNVEVNLKTTGVSAVKRDLDDLTRTRSARIDVTLMQRGGRFLP